MGFKREIESYFMDVAKIVEKGGADAKTLKLFTQILRYSNLVFWLTVVAIATFISPILGVVISPFIILFIYAAFTGASVIERYINL